MMIMNAVADGSLNTEALPRFFTKNLSILSNMLTDNVCFWKWRQECQILGIWSCYGWKLLKY